MNWTTQSFLLFSVWQCWSDMESRVSGNMPEPGSERQKKFDEGRQHCHLILLYACHRQCWSDMESRVSHNLAEPGRASERQKKFDEGRKQYHLISLFTWNLECLEICLNQEVRGRRSLMTVGNNIIRYNYIISSAVLVWHGIQGVRKHAWTRKWEAKEAWSR